MNAPDFSGALWIKSSRSAEDNNCVELALSYAQSGVRDSKATEHKTPLAFDANAMRYFISSMKRSGPE